MSGLIYFDSESKPTSFRFRISDFTMKIFLLFALLCCSCSTNTDQKAAIKIQVFSDKPKLVLQNSSYDLGTIRPNSTNKAVFNFTNTGDKTLVIKDIKKCCGAIIDLDKQELATGESGVLTAEYYAGSETGLFKREISFTTNEPNNPKTILTITGKIINSLAYSPKIFEVSCFGKDINCPEIIIKSLDNTFFAIKGFKATNQFLFLNYDPDIKATEFLIKPKINREKIKDSSETRGAIAIELDHPDYKTIELNFNITPSLESIPAQILVFNSKENEPIQKTIEIQDNQAISNGSVPSKIDSIISKNGSKVEILKCTNHDNGYELDLEIIPVVKNSSESLLKDQIVIKLKDGRTLNVPIRIFYSTQTLTSKAN